MPGSLVLLVATLAAAAPPQAAEIFASHSPKVVQVRIVATATGSRTALGTGFYVSDDGLLVTNYHVVSALVWRPANYRIELARTEAEPVKAAQLVDVDPVHDLAILRVDGPSPGTFELSTSDPEHGARLFSLGNPHDVGLSIVEGTFNGVVESELSERYHFSGSLNHGVSGGPTVDEGGKVVGINVASYGDQLSFLVPVKFARALLERVASRKGEAIPALIDRVRDAVLAEQDELSRALLAGPLPKTQLGGWELPGRWFPQLKAWGGPLNEDEPDDLFTCTGYGLRGNFVTYLKDQELTTAVRIQHRLYEPKGIGSLQLYDRASSALYKTTTSAAGDGEEFHTQWRCTTRVVSSGGSKLKANVCLRAYKKLEGVYDLAVRAMAFDTAAKTVVADLELYGFSMANAQALTGRFLGDIAWKP